MAGRTAQAAWPERGGEALMLSRVLWLSFVGGMLLLPFSTGAGDGGVVVSFGLPLLFLAAVLYVLLRLAEPRVPRDNIVPALAGGMLVIALTAGTIYSPFPLQSIARWVPNVLGAVIFCYLMSTELRIRTGEPYRVVTRVLIASAAILAGYFIVNFVFAVREVGFAAVLVDRVTGGVISLPWGATNVVASALLLPLMLSYGITGGRAERYAVGARALMVTAIALTVSRGAIAALAVGMLALFVLSPETRRRLARDAAFGLVALAAFEYWSGGLIVEHLVRPFAERLTTSDVTTLNDRTLLWDTFSRSIGDSPILGIGYFASLATFGMTGHNLVLTTLVERGILGAVLSSIVLAVAVVHALHNRLHAQPGAERLKTSALIAGGVAALLHLMVEDANFTQQYMIYSWVALALPLVWHGPDHRPSAKDAAYG